MISERAIRVSSHMHNDTCTHAERYIANTDAGLRFAWPQPLHTDLVGREIFADGSFIIRNFTGSATIGVYDISEWAALEYRAFQHGRMDRQGREKMNPDYLSASKTYPDRICKCYREGFFSIPPWPRRSRLPEPCQ